MNELTPFLLAGEAFLSFLVTTCPLSRPTAIPVAILQALSMSSPLRFASSVPWRDDRSLSHSLLAPLKHFPARVRPQKPISFGQRVLFRSCGVHEFVLGRRRLRRLYTQNPHFTFIFRSSSSPPKRTVSLPKGALIGVAPRPIYYCGTTSRSTRPGNRDRPCWGESDRSGR